MMCGLYAHGDLSGSSVLGLAAVLSLGTESSCLSSCIWSALCVVVMSCSVAVLLGTAAIVRGPEPATAQIQDDFVYFCLGAFLKVN